ncbi:MAG: lipid II flippase MurJ [Bacillota bacterium]
MASAEDESLGGGPGFGSRAGLPVRPGGPALTELFVPGQKGWVSTALVLAPFAAILLVLPAPVVDPVYGRGAFGPEAISLTATAAAYHAGAVVAWGWAPVTARTFYSLRGQSHPGEGPPDGHRDKDRGQFRGGPPPGTGRPGELMVLLRVSAFAGTYLAACAAGIAALGIPEARSAWRELRRMVGRRWVDRPG